MSSPKFLLLLACSLATLTDWASAATLSAESCQQAAVSAAIAQASTGDVVQVPSGTCTWGESGSYLALNKAITLRGAGRGATIVMISPTAGSWTSATIRISAAAVVRGLTIRTTVGASSGTAFSASANGFRITDIEYVNQSMTTNGYFVYAESYGLVDNSRITGASGTNELIFARGPANSWQTNHSIGGADNLFVENNQFLGQGYVCDCNSNSRCVIRYNTVDGPMKVDGHGKASNSPARSVRHMEVYNNRWTYTDSPYWPAIEMRGGTGRVFNNVADSTPWLLIREYGSNTSYPNFGRCMCPADYPIDDQIGVGVDPKSAASEPMYFWGNTANGRAWTRDSDGGFTSACTASCGVAFSISAIVQADRDFYISTSKPAAMSSYEPFTCPHPLAGPGACGVAAGRDAYTLAPPPPTRLRVVP